MTDDDRTALITRLETEFNRRCGVVMRSLITNRCDFDDADMVIAVCLVAKRQFQRSK